MGRAYSTRLALAVLTPEWTVYVVPPGYRAVVKTIDAMNYAAAAAYVTVATQGQGWLRLLVPGDPPSWAQAATSQVVYHGETLAIHCATSQLVVSVSGYLLDDPTGTPAGLEVIAVGELPTLPLEPE